MGTAPDLAWRSAVTPVCVLSAGFEGCLPSRCPLCVVFSKTFLFSFLIWRVDTIRGFPGVCSVCWLLKGRCLLFLVSFVCYFLSFFPIENEDEFVFYL